MDLVRSIVAYCYRQNVRKITESIGDNWTYILGNRISRRMLLGSVKKLQVEDLLVIVAMVRLPFFSYCYSIGLTQCADYRCNPHGGHVHHFANEQ
jgi:hypothetical protein